MSEEQALQKKVAAKKTAKSDAVVAKLKEQVAALEEQNAKLREMLQSTDAAASAVVESLQQENAKLREDLENAKRTPSAMDARAEKAMKPVPANLQKSSLSAEAKARIAEITARIDAGGLDDLTRRNLKLERNRLLLGK